MNSNQRPVRVAGALFLLPLLAYGIGSNLIASLASEPGHLFTIASARPQLMTGALLLVLNSLSVTGIAVLLYPVLKLYHQRTGLWYLAARIMEAIILLVGLISLLLLHTLSAEYAKTNLADPTCTDLFFQMATQSNFWAYQLAMIILGLGSIPLCHLLLKAHLVPAPLAILGLTGYALLALGACLELFGHHVGILLSLPGGLFELIFGLWLMVKGFRFKKS
jgi:hypothetical protein